jgi:hypothetical protein
MVRKSTRGGTLSNSQGHEMNFELLQRLKRLDLDKEVEPWHYQRIGFFMPCSVWGRYGFVSFQRPPFPKRRSMQVKPLPSFTVASLEA